MSDSAPAPTGGHSRTLRVVLRGLGWAVPLLLLFWVTPFGATFAPAAERTLYFKLPIEGVRYHWTFLDPEAFLSGELTLRIMNKDHDQTLVVFRDGKIQDGWKMIGDPRPDGSFYFGFETTDRVRTEPDDSLIITLKATKDLLGRGPSSEGVLSAGIHQVHGTYSAIYGKRWNPLELIMMRDEPPVAYMECWADVWPITITKREGWKGTEQDNEPGLFRKMTRSRGTDLSACESHF